MRITSNAIQQQTLAALRDGMAGMAEAQQRVATGRRLQKPSDDPVAAAGILRSARGLRALDQFARNIDSADSRLSAEEQSLDQLTNLLTRAKELATGSLSVSADASAMASARSEVEGLLSAAIEQGNARFAGGYLFGGATADRPPFAADGSVAAGANPSGDHKVDIGGSNWFATNHDGKEAFLDTGVFAALEQLSGALGQESQEGIADAMTALDGAFSGVQVKLSEVGARMNRLDVARANVEALDLNLTTLRSDLEDADMEQAVSDLVSRQIAYQSALLATSKILSTTLTDYLR